MTGHEFEAQVRAALHDAAQSVHADEVTVRRLLAGAPAPGRQRPPRRHASWLGPLLAAAAVLVIAAGVVAITRTSPHRTAAAPVTGPAPTASNPAPMSSPVSGPAQTGSRVRVTSMITDGETVGVGMPIVLRLTPAPTDASAFAKAAKVTVNGKAAGGAWFWERPSADDQRADTVEAHYRPKTYWPADATIRLDLPIAGLSAGRGLVFDRAPASVTFRTGDAHISVVDGATHTMVVRSNDKMVRTVAVSLGKAATPTSDGVKVVMGKGEQDATTGQLRPDGAVRMVGPGYDVLATWSVQLTASGEYVLAAPWNSQIGRTSTSNGTTNLATADARWFFGFSQIGDVVQYVNTGGTTTPSWDGYGDWNVPWSQWRSGGLLLNHD